MIKKEHFWEKGGMLETFLILAIVGLVVLYYFDDGFNNNSQNITINGSMYMNKTYEVNATSILANFSGFNCSEDAQSATEK